MECFLNLLCFSHTYNMFLVESLRTVFVKRKLNLEDDWTSLLSSLLASSVLDKRASVNSLIPEIINYCCTKKYIICPKRNPLYNPA